MELYTERHGMRTPIERTSTITVEMYSLLFDCCEKHYINIAWKFPDQCPDGHGCCGLNLQQFYTSIKFDIPTLYRDLQGRIAKPEANYYGAPEKFDQFALLDLIEFLGHNCKDISYGEFHSFFMHNHINLLDTNNVTETFRNEINEILQKTGLLFVLTEKMIIERVSEYGVISPQVERVVAGTKEIGVRDLLTKAIGLFKTPNPLTRNDAVEKLWDAFERLKTYYTTLDKKDSATKIVTDMSGGESNFRSLFENEFKALTTIGNSYRIRHHETDKIGITDSRHFDYLFNRCLSLIATAVEYLQ